jgi:MipA family protein
MIIIMKLLNKASIFTMLLSLPALNVQAGQWTVGLAGGGSRFMDYPASGHYRELYGALPYFTYKGDNLTLGDGGLGWKFINNDKVKLTFSVSGSLPAGSDDNPARKGMTDLDFLFEIGPKIQFKLLTSERHTIIAEVPLRGIFAVDWVPDYQGLNFEPSMSYKFKHDDVSVSFKSSVSLVSQKIHQNYYQVINDDVSADRTEFKVDQGGLLDISSRLSLGKSWDTISLFISAGINHYGLSPSKNSPLHQEDYSVSVATGFAWQVWKSK